MVLHHCNRPVKLGSYTMATVLLAFLGNQHVRLRPPSGAGGGEPSLVDPARLCLKPARPVEGPFVDRQVHHERTIDQVAPIGYFGLDLHRAVGIDTADQSNCRTLRCSSISFVKSLMPRLRWLSRISRASALLPSRMASTSRVCSLADSSVDVRKESIVRRAR